MNRLAVVILLFFGTTQLAFAQELFIFTEPASNMPAKAIGLRLTNEGSFSKSKNNRALGEVMVGLNKNLMFHVQGFLSNMDGDYQLEGASFYAKYRLLSIDGVNTHFRAAVFGRVSTSNRATYTEDLNLEGDNSGWQGGVVLTKLLHRLALSSTISYSNAFNQKENEGAGTLQPGQLLGYSLSSGYLLFPVVYKNYKQPNLNLYFEMLGKTNLESGHSYIDFAPGVQVILDSRTRIDFGYRFQATGNMPDRYLKNMYLARIEFNFFNAL